MADRSIRKRHLGFSRAIFSSIILFSACVSSPNQYYYNLNPGEDGLQVEPFTRAVQPDKTLQNPGKRTNESGLGSYQGPYEPMIVQRADGTKVVNAEYGNLTELQQDVLQAAQKLLGTKPNATVTVNGRTYVCDCIGSVGAIFFDAGIDIFVDFGTARNANGGVDLLYKILEAQDVLHTSYLPAVGDVIFWDNTYDRNGDGIIGNDLNTHVGIVVKVDKDGTIHYLHENQFTGIVIERMNLYQPDVHRDPVTGKLLNSPMYSGSYQGNPNNPDKWLAGDLWKQFGGILRMADEGNES
jgi:cell wall-associated NlpC family hydrolase